MKLFHAIAFSDLVERYFQLAALDLLDPESFAYQIR